MLYFLQWNRRQDSSPCEINHIKCIIGQALICFAVSSVPVCKQFLLSSLLRSRRSQSVWSRSESHPSITLLFAQVLNPSLGVINRSIFSFQTRAGLYWGSCVGWTEDFRLICFCFITLPHHCSPVRSQGVSARDHGGTVPLSVCV